ncbi:Uncharacterised protein [Mycobacteroides abscessus subsp. massiliense]|nr:Uncharacterised protein [Mycobacteroides abscessus subsp. massiliense]
MCARLARVDAKASSRPWLAAAVWKVIIMLLQFTRIRAFLLRASWTLMRACWGPRISAVEWVMMAALVLGASSLCVRLLRLMVGAFLV